MVSLILGKEGKGKSRYLLEYSEKALNEANGNLIFLDRNSKQMYDLNRKIRLVDVSQYDVESSQEFIGFILGLISEDNDLEQILIDGFLDIACLDQDQVGPTINRLSDISDKFNVKIVISICMDDKLPEGLNADILATL